jgi:RNA polymerase sigma factor FliA
MTNPAIQESISLKTGSADQGSAQDIAVTFMPFAEAIVIKVSKALQLPSRLHEEFQAAAYFGLVEAATRYDPGHGIPFERYAYVRIKGAIIDYIRSCSDLSSSAYRLSRRLQGMQEYGRVGGQNLAEFGLDEQSLKQTQVDAGKGNLSSRVSLNELVEDSVQLELDAKNPEQVLLAKEEAETLWDKVSELPQEQSQIVEQYYLNDVSFTDIARLTSTCSKSWVSRLHQRALNNLKDQLND